MRRQDPPMVSMGGFPAGLNNRAADNAGPKNEAGAPIALRDAVNVSLRNDLMESKTLDVNRTVGIIASNVSQYYERKPMEDFEYLADEAVPSTWVMVLALIIGFGASIWMGIYFHQNECFEGRGTRFRRRF